MTAVIDSSAVVDWLLEVPRAKRVAASLRSHGTDLHAPQLLLPETVFALKGIERGRKEPAARVARAMKDMLRLPTNLWDLEPLTKRVWQLRHAISTYDAYYVALAEHLDARLVTADAKLARAVEAGGGCPVDLVV